MTIFSNPSTVALVYLGLVSATSLICFVAYWIDKGRAVRGGHRISERTLHILAFAGGWPGAIAAQRKFRHKTRKLSFRLVFWLVVLLHVGVVAAAGYIMFRHQ